MSFRFKYKIRYQSGQTMSICKYFFTFFEKSYLNTKSQQFLIVGFHFLCMKKLVFYLSFSPFLFMIIKEFRC